MADVLTKQDFDDIDAGLALYAQSIGRQMNKYAVGTPLHTNFKAEYDRIPAVRSKISQLSKGAK